MSRAADIARPARTLLAALDLVRLTKPRIVLLTVLMAGLGLWLAPGVVSVGLALAALTGTALAVASANALNMYVERDVDGLMARTRGRPLPAGRLRPGAALIFGLVVGTLSLVLLAAVNPLTAALGGFALGSYVLIYTPLKRRTDWALLIGAVPGAAPPVMGWAAVTGALDIPALVLFGILFLWQMPHFLAIALYHRTDYERAGIRVTPVVRGDRSTKRQALIFTIGLVVVSLLLVPLGVAGAVYAVFALAVGTWFTIWAARGLTDRSGPRWARRFFFVSLYYLPVLSLGLVADKLLL